MKALLKTRWIEFIVGCGILLLAYTGSPRTMIEVFIVIGGIACGGLLLILSWMRDRQQANADGRSIRQ